MTTLWTVDDLARRLGVTVRYVRRLIAERRVPFIKCGHYIRFDPDQIEQWIQQNRVEQDRPLATVTVTPFRGHGTRSTRSTVGAPRPTTKSSLR